MSQSNVTMHIDRSRTQSNIVKYSFNLLYWQFYNRLCVFAIWVLFYVKLLLLILCFIFGQVYNLNEKLDELTHGKEAKEEEVSILKRELAAATKHGDNLNIDRADTINR